MDLGTMSSCMNFWGVTIDDRTPSSRHFLWKFLSLRVCFLGVSKQGISEVNKKKPIHLNLDSGAKLNGIFARFWRKNQEKLTLSPSSFYFIYENGPSLLLGRPWSTKRLRMGKKVVLYTLVCQV